MGAVGGLGQFLKLADFFVCQGVFLEELREESDS